MSKKAFDKSSFDKSSFDKSSFDKSSFDKSSFDKSSFIRDLEEDESNYEIPENDEKDFNFSEKFNFSDEFIKEIMGKIIDEINPTFITIFDISVFLGTVAKRIAETVIDGELSFKSKYSIVIGISKVVVDELETRGLIDLEMANDFREMFKESDEYNDIISGISSFMSSSKEEKQVIVQTTIKNLTQKLLSSFLE
jgi:hypothetical protein